MLLLALPFLTYMYMYMSVQINLRSIPHIGFDLL